MNTQLDTQLNFDWGSGNDRQTMYYVLKPDTSPSNVTMVNHNQPKRNVKIIFVWLPHYSLKYGEILTKCREEIDAEPSVEKHWIWTAMRNV